MDWVTEMKKINDNWDNNYFMRNSYYYSLTVYTFLALSKCVVEDYTGAALQIRRLLKSCLQLKKKDMLHNCSTFYLISCFLSDFKINCLEDYNKLQLDNWYKDLF